VGQLFNCTIWKLMSKRWNVVGELSLASNEIDKICYSHASNDMNMMLMQRNKDKDGIKYCLLPTSCQFHSKAHR
jgi:hypothetical protein